MQHRGGGAEKSDGGRGKKRRTRGTSKVDAPIDTRSIRELLVLLAPKAFDDRIDAALEIVVKSVAIYRRSAPAVGQHPFKPDEGFKNFRRKLSSYQKKFRKHALSDDPFSAFPEGKIKDAASLLYLLKLSQFQNFLGHSQTGDVIKQALLNDVVGIHGTEIKGIVENMLETAAAKGEREEDLAGYVYLAISRGLEIKPAMTRFDPEDPPMKTGCNYARLLTKAMSQAGAELPIDLRPLMVRGKKQAKFLLSPAIQYGDGRSYSYFDLFHEREL